MKEILRKTRDFIIEMKVLMGRTISYLSILNSGMILFLMLSKLKELGYISFDLTNTFFIYFAGILILLFLGWLDVKILKGMQSEQARVMSLNPAWDDVRYKINYLYEKNKKNEQ